MKVLLVSDFGIHHNPGGAQRSNQIIIDEGKKLGHDITCFHYDSSEDILKRDYDIVISSNLAHILEKRPNIDIIDYFHRRSHQHVRLEHDMNYYINTEQRERLFSHTKKAVFLTKTHFNFFKKHYNTNTFYNVEYVADPIDTSVFYNYNQYRSQAILHAGFLHKLKGFDRMLRYMDSNQDKNFAVYGWGENSLINELLVRPNCQFYGSLDYSFMPQLLNSYKQMYFDPDMPEPFCRTVGEALCCGMEIVTSSEQIGCLELYKEIGHDAFVSAVDSAAIDFWNVILED